jgi:hypothetical protein
MVSKSKLYKKLDQLEAELEEQLVPHLENAAKGHNDLVFCVSAFNPFPELKSRTDKVTEELVELGSQVIALKKKLGEATEGSIAERICWYCREWGNNKNSHQKTSQGLALQFLQEISNVRRTT